ACPLEEKRHGAFRRLQVDPCNSFRKITPASVAVPCGGSAGAATTSAVPSVGDGGSVGAGGGVSGGGGAAGSGKGALLALAERIRRRAYQFYNRRGRQHLDRYSRMVASGEKILSRTRCLNWRVVIRGSKRKCEFSSKSDDADGRNSQDRLKEATAVFH